MKVSVCLLFLLTPALAGASPQDDRAYDIENMSNTYSLMLEEGDAATSATVLLLNGCTMTTLQTFQAASGNYTILSSNVNLWDVQFGTPEMPTGYEIINEPNVSPRPIGMIRYSSSARIVVNAHLASKTIIPPDVAQERPHRGTRSYASWRYAADQLNEDAIASLALALVKYQQDFCTGMS